MLRPSGDHARNSHWRRRTKIYQRLEELFQSARPCLAAIPGPRTVPRFLAPDRQAIFSFEQRVVEARRPGLPSIGLGCVPYLHHDVIQDLMITHFAQALREGCPSWACLGRITNFRGPQLIENALSTPKNGSKSIDTHATFESRTEYAAPTAFQQNSSQFIKFGHYSGICSNARLRTLSEGVMT
jgi:hypothetical protein